MKKPLKKVSSKNTQELKFELGRAHLIIALLSLAISALLALGATQSVEFEPTLSAICVAMLSIVIILSLGTSISLFRKK